MSYELRYIERIIPTGNHNGHPHTIKVLQYRRKVHTDWAYDWSEWKDVPTVKEEKDDAPKSEWTNQRTPYGIVSIKEAVLLQEGPWIPEIDVACLMPNLERMK